jgi:hypothetical protein
MNKKQISIALSKTDNKNLYNKILENSNDVIDIIKRKKISFKEYLDKKYDLDKKTTINRKKTLKYNKNKNSNNIINNRIETKLNNKPKKNPIPIKKQIKTLKYSRNDIFFIIKTLKKHIDNNSSFVLTKIKALKRYQFIKILTYFNIIHKTTKAPLPILKNILYNIILGGIYITK